MRRRASVLARIELSAGCRRIFVSSSIILAQWAPRPILGQGEIHPCCGARLRHPPPARPSADPNPSYHSSRADRLDALGAPRSGSQSRQGGLRPRHRRWSGLAWSRWSGAEVVTAWKSRSSRGWRAAASETHPSPTDATTKLSRRNHVREGKGGSKGRCKLPFGGVVVAMPHRRSAA